MPNIRIRQIIDPETGSMSTIREEIPDFSTSVHRPTSVGTMAATAEPASRVCADCDVCSMDYEECEDCGEPWRSGDLSEGYCSGCADNHGDDWTDSAFKTRDYHKGKDFRDSEKSAAPLQSMRPFGVELELVVKNNGLANKVCKELDKNIGIHYDGSINGGVGMEIVTPVMNGIKAVNMVEKMTEKIREHGGKVNRSCGYHVHIDMADVDSDEYSSHRKLKDLWLFYIAYEDVIMSFIPNSRRNNRYCHVLRSDYNFMEIYNSQNTSELEKIWYRESSKQSADRRKGDHKDSSRYRGINMHTLFAERHIEIRYHSGTINSKKILEWANLHLMIADTVFFRGLEYGNILASVNEINLVKKTESFFKILKIDGKSEKYFKARQSHFMKEAAILEPDKESKAEMDTLLEMEEEL